MSSATNGSRDVEPELLQRLGHLVIRWSYLEHLISELFVWSVDGDAAPMTIVTANISSGTLADWTRSVLDAALDTSENSLEIRNILSEFDRLRRDRNVYVHGVWSTRSEPMSATVQTVRLERTTVIEEVVVTAPDLDSLIREVLDLIGSLRELLLKLGVKV